MNPLIILTAVIAAASAAPAPGNYATAGLAIAPAIAPAVAPAAYAAPAPAISLPAPLTTTEVRGAPTVSVHQPPAQISKQLHYADRTFVSGYSTQVLKPAIPDFRIAVPTALKGTETVNPAIVHTQKEIHTVNEPVPVERPYNVPYDVPKYIEQIVEVPQPVHVSKPYAVPHPVPVAGEPIIQKVRTAPVVKHTHLGAVAAPAIHHGATYGLGLGHAAVAGYGLGLHGAAIAAPAIAAPVEAIA